MKQGRVLVGVGVVVLVVGVGIGAFATSQTYHGSSVESYAVLGVDGSTFRLSDAEVEPDRVQVPNLHLAFDVPSPSLYTLSTTTPGAVVLKRAMGCDTPPPLGTRLAIISDYRTPSGPTGVLPNPLIETGQYLIVARFVNSVAQLGQYNCDALDFQIDIWADLSIILYPMVPA